MTNYSIIIPHKNSFDLLERCIESIPSREDVQIIVVDDNSDKGIVDWNSIDLPIRVELICTYESRGAGYARNVGLSKAKGKWVLFADCDDYFSDGFLDILDKHCNSEYDVIYYNHYNVDNGVKSESNNYGHSLKDYLSTGLQQNLDAIKYRKYVPWNKMVKRSFLERNAIQFEECINGNDIFFSFQVGYFSTLVGVDTFPVYNYVSNSSSLTHNKKNSDEYYLCIFKHRYQCNRFFDYIGHNEWRHSVIKKFFSILVKKGFPSFIQAIRVYCCNYRIIKDRESMFVDYFKTKNNGL